MEGEEMSFKLDKICKSYGDNVIFRDFDMEFEEGVISCILGPSGCGKTTLLNIIGSIAEPDSGVLSGSPDKKFSYIFQEPRLLPWKTVRGNIEFVLNRTLPARERRENADKLINMVELNGFANYYPAQLSGGMKQRVSIARAFASPSDIILMDEPLAGLDFTLKQNMIRWFSNIWESDKRSVIFITHDIDEALMLGNDIFVFGKPPVGILDIEQIKTAPGQRSLLDSQIQEIKNRLIASLGYDK